ncbi:shikimate dehydrogenase [Leucobacter exalbidus]|uniref:Shikimate dehydrogenase n=1 Tax=Leucobacter exalbidus TaxID=662960 RepID=A0A940PR60_9MICO|nr:shikimate dehydrogenase [Leucobacter exalbidus]MBP1325122.1 shikimate dehydrogenase [Leucobacter exalbidus]
MTPVAAAAAPARQLAVLGHPIAHSKSPLIHRAAYRELGLDWKYRAIRCGEESLAALLAGRGPEWRGFSVTMPLKDEAYRSAVSLDPVAVESGVVNTLLRVDDEAMASAAHAGMAHAETSRAAAPQWAGFNTDVAGLARAIAGAGLDATRTIVLGAGATSGSAVLAARSLGAEHITVMARRLTAATEITRRFAGTPGVTGAPLEMAAAELLPAATPVTPEEAAAPGSPTLVISTLPGHGVDWSGLAVPAGVAPLFDVAYSPWPSHGAQTWRAAGGTAHSGIDMLVEQALVQVRIFVMGSPTATLPNEARVLQAMREAAA